MKRLVFAPIVFGVSALGSGQDLEFRTAKAAIAPVGLRSVIRIDPIEKAIITGQLHRAAIRWQPVTANEKGVFRSSQLSHGYLWFSVDSPKAQSVFMDTRGPSWAFVNQRAVHVDRRGVLSPHTPIELREGQNEIIFYVSGGEFSIKTRAASSGLSLDLNDATLPDLRGDEPGEVYGGFVTRNFSAEWQKGLIVEAQDSEGNILRSGPFNFAPQTVRKLPIRLPASLKPISLRLVRAGKVLASTNVTLKAGTKEKPYRRTFLSPVDGSVQLYAVREGDYQLPGLDLVLGLHGGGVDPLDFAGMFKSKSWGNIVCPLDRRSFGFDGIGRIDTMAALDDAQRIYAPDPNRIFLSGHSMGGHGAWSIGSLYPDRFAGILTSAGYLALSKYGSQTLFAESTSVAGMFNRAYSWSEVLDRRTNFDGQRLFAMCGTADQHILHTNLLAQATGNRPNFKIFRKEGGEHWWGKNPDGTWDCIDWTPGFDFIRDGYPNDRPTHIDFTTVDPAVSRKEWWLAVGEQPHPHELSRVVADEVSPMVVKIQTRNLTSLRLDRARLSQVTIDGQPIAIHQPGPYGFVAQDGRWKLAGSPDAVTTTAHGATAVFDRRYRLVIPTHGSPLDRRLGLEVARYFAEQIYSSWSGDAQILTDDEAVLESKHTPDFNYVALGRPDCNSLLKSLETRNELKVNSGSVALATRKLHRSDLATLNLVRRGPQLTLAVGWTGEIGARLVARTPFFSFSTAFPDLLVWSPEVLTRGLGGYLAAGYTAPTEIAWATKK